jgi:quercetin dioxygenase-like cupin family protein
MLAQQSPETKVGGEDAVPQPSVGQVDDPAAHGHQALLPFPFLLELESLAEQADALEAPARNCHVRAPHLAHLGVGVGQFQHRPSQRMPAAGAGRRGLEAGSDRPSEASGLWMTGCPRGQRCEPLRWRHDVVIDQADQVSARFAQSRVASGVRVPTTQPEEADLGDVGKARKAPAPESRLLGGAVLDHEDLEAANRIILSRQAPDALDQRLDAIPRRDDDRDERLTPIRSASRTGLHVPESVKVTPMHDGDLRADFSERGYLAPTRLFSEEESRLILAGLRGEEGPPLDWSKGWAVTSPSYHMLATNDRILDLVTGLIGADVLLWGASLLAREPGEAHPWHTDIESASQEGGTLAVWIGLAHTTVYSSLKVVPFSHRFGVALQQVSQESGADRAKLTDAVVAGWATDRDSRSGVVPLEAADGDVVAFDGRLWHGSHNLNRHGTRYAALLQYATPRTPIRIPDFTRLEWPFESYHTPRAPCVAVSGRDVHGVNRVIPGPAEAGYPGMPALTTRVHSLQLPLEQDQEVGWKPHALFRGATPNVKNMGCHASVLDPGCEPHAPHRHDEEELLLVLDGEATLVVEDADRRDALSELHAQPGTFAYYPAGFAHTIRNASDAPVTYVMFKWHTTPGTNGHLLGHHLVRSLESSRNTDDTDSNGFSTTGVLDGGTKCLRHLHSHVTTLQSGAGYPPHVDAHDVAIIVLQGTVETLGEQVGPNGVIFYAAGESHGMRNVGDAPAVYVVFEFHGRHLPYRRPQSRDPRLATRRRRAKRKAMRVARPAVEVARRTLRIS